MTVGCTINPLNEPEQTATTCQDGTDNDKDGKIDCADPGCQGFTFCQEKTEETSSTCQDKKDNDGDKLVDCADPDCQGFVFCAGGGEFTPTACQDKKDNDNDGKIDCDDVDCQAFVFCQKQPEDNPLACQDGKDNDNDNKIDCDDDKCKLLAVCALSENTSTDCQDRKDNDNDGKIDCEDTDCQGFTFCTAQGEATPATCQDKKDNDNDGKIDCEDTDCQGFTFCQKPGENTSAACQDKKDNDGDQKVDCDDAECQVFAFCQQNSNSEATTVACQDKKDNDNDGKIDCEDTDCQGFTFCQQPTEATAAACQDKKDNDNDGKIDCADPGCQLFVFCQTQQADESSYSACRDKKDNDKDGKIDCDDSDCWHWFYCGHYNGSPITDAWGATWDSLSRPAAKWSDANDKCKALGGRLPTATELFRNNTSTGPGGGGISPQQATEYLWTTLSNYQGRKYILRLNDGRITVDSITNKQAYRCIWPPTTPKSFTAGNCFGPPGKGCLKTGELWNIDAMDRPTLDYAAATTECRMANGSIPTLRDWTQVLHEGLPNGVDQWLWTSDASAWSSKRTGHAVIKWKGVANPSWHYTNSTMGSLGTPSSAYRFRCIGLRTQASIQLPKPTCQGGCKTLTKRRSTIIIDQQDRGPAKSEAAAAACRALGAHLPTVAEFTELIQDGLPNGADKYVWTSDPVVYSIVSFGRALVRWKGAGKENWSYLGWGTNASYAPTSSEHMYRCVWRGRLQAWPTCKAGEVLQRTANGTLQCAAGGAGSSQGKANNEIIDSWKAAWDGADRSSKNFATAAADCKMLGGRLPTPNELYRVRARSNPHKSIGTTRSTNQLWTSAPTQSGQRAVVRISDGNAYSYPETSGRSYRCIWPAKTSAVLRGNNCYGPPGSECIEKNGLVIDAYQRISIELAAAIHDCKQAGGRLPRYGTFVDLIQQGLPNGTGNGIWLFNPATWINTNGRYFGQVTAKWSGAGTPAWGLDRNTGGVGITKSAFRCVYSPFVE